MRFLPILSGLPALLAGGAIMTTATPVRAETGGLVVKACPSDLLHAYALAPGTRFQSLVVPDIAVENRGSGAVTLTEVRLELLDHGVVTDTRRLAGPALQAALKSGSAVGGGALAAFPFQFCDGRLLGKAPTLSAGADLAPAAAGLVTNQVFGWKGARDQLRIVASGARDGRAEEASFIVPVSAEVAHTHLRFPMRGRWFVAVAGTPHGGHRWALPEAFALDIVQIGAEDRTFRGSGTRFEDYYAYGAPVLAAGDGVVAEVVDDQPEDLQVLRRPGESLEAYGERAGEVQNRLLAGGDHAIAGNTVLIDHGDGEYSLYAHLKPGSIAVKRGEAIKAGAAIARLGASGNATEPHLHFQLCDAPSALHCAGIPLAFSNIELPYADGPRGLQAGDIVEARASP